MMQFWAQDGRPGICARALVAARARRASEVSILAVSVDAGTRSAYWIKE